MRLVSYPNGIFQNTGRSSSSCPRSPVLCPSLSSPIDLGKGTGAKCGTHAMEPFWSCISVSLANLWPQSARPACRRRGSAHWSPFLQHTLPHLQCEGHDRARSTCTSIGTVNLVYSAILTETDNLATEIVGQIKPFYCFYRNMGENCVTTTDEQLIWLAWLNSCMHKLLLASRKRMEQE
jgi:hypothetical protein